MNENDSPREGVSPSLSNYDSNSPVLHVVVVGFHHKKVKELGAATAFTFVLLYYQPNLNKMMKYLTVRWKNTFEGRSLMEGLKLLNKPAVKPTVTDDNEKEKDGKNKNPDKS